MKRIEATIKPFKLEAVLQCLMDLGINGVTISETKGFGRQRGHTEVYRGSEYTFNLLPKFTIVAVVEDGDCERIVSAIATTAKTGKIGDGKIFVMNVESALRIRTDETGNAALA